VTTRRVLVITTDPLTERMPGPAIRAWHLAEVLAAEHEVTLASSIASTRLHPDMAVVHADEAQMSTLAEAADVVVGPGSVVRRYPRIARSEVPLVVDIYDPYQLENLEANGEGGLADQSENIAHLNAVVREDLVRGDFFLCASARQRDFWLGSLAAVGRVNPYTYEEDPTMHRLVDVVPFGLPSLEPTRTGQGLRDTIEGIGPDDPVVVWGGGVYSWFDPLSLLRAVDQARRSVTDVRLVFLGMRNPNPHIPEMRAAVEVRQLAAQLGLVGRHVFFNEGWVPYDRRADFLLDANLGVSTHLDHIESRFSFRTRVLDYLWAGLPMLLTAGDSLTELVAASGAGISVPAADVDAIAQGLISLLENPPHPDVVRTLAARFRWPDVAGPLVAFCCDPQPAPDRHLRRATDGALVLSMSPMADTKTPTAPPDLPGSESALGLADASYLAQIRGAMSRIGRRTDTDDDGLASALADLDDAAGIDIDVPTASRRREAVVVKQGVKKLTGWYLRYLAQQITVLGQATSRLGTALVERADRIEDTTSGLVEEMARLRARLDRLERADGASLGSAPAATAAEDGR
jgi:glycosyltransferase involved in cell wall biosynthesis